MANPPPMSEASAPEREGYTPSDGKVFSTVRITMECVADVVVEHDEDLDGDAIAKAVKAHLPQVSERARWWNPTSEKTTSVVVHVGETNPDGLDEAPQVYECPFALDADAEDVDVVVA